MPAVEPVAALGAELSGISFANGVDDATVERIRDAWARHLVVVVRWQSLTPPQLVELAARLGELDPAPAFDNPQSSLPGFPELAVVSNVREGGRAIGGLGSGDLSWHSDMTYRAAPPAGCLLHAVEVPATGGDTHFLSMAAALAALPAALRQRIDKLLLTHDARYTSAGTARLGDDAERPGADHPLVVQDTVSRLPCLLLGRRRKTVFAGRDESDVEGAALLDALWQHVESGDFSIAHRWQPGDLVLWSNLGVMHRRDAFDENARRILYRAQIATLHA